MKRLLFPLLCAAVLAGLLVVIRMTGFAGTSPLKDRDYPAARDDKTPLLTPGTSGCGRSEEGDAFESTQLRDLFQRLKAKEKPTAAGGEREKTPAP